MRYVKSVVRFRKFKKNGNDEGRRVGRVVSTTFFQESLRSWYFWAAVLVAVAAICVIADSHRTTNMYLQALKEAGL